jgi:hypothetical protein
MTLYLCIMLNRLRCTQAWHINRVPAVSWHVNSVPAVSSASDSNQFSQYTVQHRCQVLPDDQTYRHLSRGNALP